MCLLHRRVLLRAKIYGELDPRQEQNKPNDQPATTDHPANPQQIPEDCN